MYHSRYNLTGCRKRHVRMGISWCCRPSLWHYLHRSFCQSSVYWIILIFFFQYTTAFCLVSPRYTFCSGLTFFGLWSSLVLATLILLLSYGFISNHLYSTSFQFRVVCLIISFRRNCILYDRVILTVPVEYPLSVSLSLVFYFPSIHVHHCN